MPLRPQKVSYLGAYVVAIVSLLSGAAVVHNIFKPDLVRVPEHRDVHRLAAHDLCCAALRHNLRADDPTRRPRQWIRRGRKGRSAAAARLSTAAVPGNMPPARPLWDVLRPAEEHGADSNGGDRGISAGNQIDQLAETVLHNYMSVYHGAICAGSCRLNMRIL